MISSIKKLTWQLPDGSMRYNCGPASSYAANRVDVPNGLHTWHSRLEASLSHLEATELQTWMSGGGGHFIQACIHSVHSPGVPIQIEDMHKACHPVCKDLAWNDVSIKAAPQANSLGVILPLTMVKGSDIHPVDATLPCSPLIAPAFLAGSVDYLSPICDNARYRLQAKPAPLTALLAR